MKRFVIIALVLIAASILVMRGQKPKVIVLHGTAMGCQWKLACHGDVPDSLQAEIASELETWEQILSTWRKDSDISKFNHGQDASKELQRVIDLAEAFKEQTNGAYDMKVLNAVHLAGFGPSGDGIDLSGLGKGFAVDRVGERLHALGITHFIFELGGDVLAAEGDWKCEIASPVSGQAPHEITISNQAVATSGNSYQFKQTPDGLTTHIIDPRSGRPVISERIQSVTVIADDCSTADAWATALFVLGPEAKPSNAPEFMWRQEPH